MGKPTYTIEVFKGEDEQIYWRARHRNGRIVADGAEGYRAKRSALRAFERLADRLRAADYRYEDKR